MRGSLFKTGFTEAAASNPKEAHALFMFIYTPSHILITGFIIFFLYSEERHH